MAYAFLAQSANIIGYNIPLFLLAFGILYLIMAFAVKPAGGQLNFAIAGLVIAGSFAWFVASGSGFSGLSIPPDVLTVAAVGLVGIVLAKVFAGS